MTSMITSTTDPLIPKSSFQFLVQDGERALKDIAGLVDFLLRDGETGNPSNGAVSTAQQQQAPLPAQPDRLPNQFVILQWNTQDETSASGGACDDVGEEFDQVGEATSKMARDPADRGKERLG